MKKKRCCIASAGIRNRVKVLFSSGALMVQNRVNNKKYLILLYGGGVDVIVVSVIKIGGWGGEVN